MSVPALSIVAPVYNEAPILPELVARCLRAGARTGRAFEVVLADDASTDGTPAVLATFADDPRVRPCRLPANAGQFGATQAGLRAARGEWVVVLDGDLQDPPEAIPDLVAALAAAPPAVLAVLAVKSRRDDPRPFMLAQFVFHRLQHLLSRVALPLGAGSYSIMRRAVAERIAAADLRRANLAPVIAVTVRAMHGALATIAYEKAARYDGSGRVGWRGLAAEALESLALTGALPRLFGLAAAGLALVALLPVIGGGGRLVLACAAAAAAGAALAVGRRARGALASLRAPRSEG